MENTVEVLLVNCGSCKEGKVTVLELVNDDYNLGCTHCRANEWMHYTGMDNLYDQNEYASQINDDVRVLKSNGKWDCLHEGQLANDSFDVEEFVCGMKLISTIKSHDYGNSYYYQKGLEFIMIEEDHIARNKCRVFKYIADANKIDNLLAHFLKRA